MNRLCVRLVFCLYAEDAGIFPKDCLRRLVEATPLQYLRGQLQRLFQTLDTPAGKRDPFLEPELAAFPYTNGGLFRNAAQSGIPPITEEIRSLLVGVAPSRYRHIAPVMERLARVVEMRRKSPTKSVQRDAEKPMLFTQIRQPQTDYLVVPEVSSERRKYIPIGYLTPDVIASNKLYIIPNASPYLFGVLTSSIHMAWMRVVAGRLESRYSYSPAVYNNFPWPAHPGNPVNPVTNTSAGSAPPRLCVEKISATAQGILDARARYPDSSLADLYDPLTMPPDLRAAHEANDRAVLAAYGLAPDTSEPEIVAHLFKLYAEKSNITSNIGD